MEQVTLLMTSLYLPSGLICFCVVQIIVVVWTCAAVADPAGCLLHSGKPLFSVTYIVTMIFF